MRRKQAAHSNDLKRWAESGDFFKLCFATHLGVSVLGNSQAVFSHESSKPLKGQVQLVFTSPPFPLNRKKRYGNKEGEQFKSWLSGFAPVLREILKPNGSIVLEMGNAWEPGEPVMSTLALESLLEFKKSGGFFLCQEFIWYNPAKLPTPAQWVNVERIRVKDAFTRLWWLSNTTKPKADNRNVLKPYSASMKSLLTKQTYNAGPRPSEHIIGQTSFLTDNGGAIPPNVLMLDEQPALDNLLSGANTSHSDGYISYCKSRGIVPHPARMPAALAEFFVRLCTDPGDLVVDPFAGSNTTGAVAERLGRRWIAVEANEAYVESSRGRFLNLSPQAPLEMRDFALE